MQTIDLVDFTPGVFDDWYSGPQPAPDGAAQLTGTYGCVSSPTGGLMPGPGLVGTNIESPFNTPVDSTHYPPTDQNVHIAAMRILSPIIGPGFNFTQPGYPDALCVLYAYYFDPGGTGTFANLRLNFKSFIYQFSHGVVTRYSLTTATSTVAPSTSYPFTNPCFIDISRANNATPTSPGNPTAFFSAKAINGNTDMAIAFPNQATPTTNSTQSWLGLGSTPQGAMFAHQDRIIFLNNVSTEFAFGPMTVPAEDVQFTNVNDFSGVGTRSVYVAENPSGVGSFVSMNASEALFVKRNNGGFIVSGPMESPIITRMPGIPGADPMNIGCMTPDGGYVYGNRRGIWEWGGGDSANLLSNQLSADGFWVPSGYDVLSYQAAPSLSGIFAFSYPYVFCPNNFIFDTSTRSWWVLGSGPTNPYLTGNPASNTYSYYQTSTNGNVIAMPATFNTANQPIIDFYNMSSGQPIYQWTSQPLARSRGRFLDIRFVSILTQGVGTVVVTLTGITGATGSVTFNCNSTTPQLQTSPISCKSTDVVVQVLSTASGIVTTLPANALPGSLPIAPVAPRVERLSFDYHEVETAR